MENQGPEQPKLTQRDFEERARSMRDFFDLISFVHSSGRSVITRPVDPITRMPTVTPSEPQSNNLAPFITSAVLQRVRAIAELFKKNPK